MIFSVFVHCIVSIAEPSSLKRLRFGALNYKELNYLIVKIIQIKINQYKKVVCLNIQRLPTRKNRVLPLIHPQDNATSFFHLITSLTLKPPNIEYSNCNFGFFNFPVSIIMIIYQVYCLFGCPFLTGVHKIKEVWCIAYVAFRGLYLRLKTHGVSVTATNNNHHSTTEWELSKSRDVVMYY